MSYRVHTGANGFAEGYWSSMGPSSGFGRTATVRAAQKRRVERDRARLDALIVAASLAVLCAAFVVAFGPIAA